MAARALADLFSYDNPMVMQKHHARSMNDLEKGDENPARIVLDDETRLLFLLKVK